MNPKIRHQGGVSKIKDAVSLIVRPGLAAAVGGGVVPVDAVDLIVARFMMMMMM